MTSVKNCFCNTFHSMRTQKKTTGIATDSSLSAKPIKKLMHHLEPRTQATNEIAMSSLEATTLPNR